MTTIPSRTTRKSIDLNRHVHPGGVWLKLTEPDCGNREIVVDRNVLLDAVRSVLGVLTIDKADLPEVTDRGVHGNLFIGATPWPAGASPQALRQDAYDRLALAEYLEAHPPVDEQQVEALADVLRFAAGVTPEDIAANVLRAGYSKGVR